MKYILIYLYSVVIITFLINVLSFYFKVDLLIVSSFWLLYIAFYSLLIFGCLVILIIVFEFITKSYLIGFSNTYDTLSKYLYSIILLIVLCYAFGKTYKYITNTTIIVIENGSKFELKDISLEGRNEKVFINYLDIESKKERKFRGKHSISTQSNNLNYDYLTLKFNIDNKSNVKEIEAFTSILPDTMVIQIFSLDSIKVF